MERFEAAHSPRDALCSQVVLLENIILIFDLQDFDGLPSSGEFQDHIHGFRPRHIGPAFVDNDAVGDTVVVIARRKKRRAASLSQRSNSVKSRGWPSDAFPIELLRQSMGSTLSPNGSRLRGQHRPRALPVFLRDHDRKQGSKDRKCREQDN